MHFELFIQKYIGIIFEAGDGQIGGVEWQNGIIPNEGMVLMELFNIQWLGGGNALGGTGIE
jgi:hypothetical protein